MQTIDPGVRRKMFVEAAARRSVTQSVIVTGSFRAGTSYICELLQKNGLLEVSKEKFADYYQFIVPGVDAEFASAIQNTFENSTFDGVFRCKLMWPHRNYLAKSLGIRREDSRALAEIFPGSKWLNIIRRDKIDQAVSFWKAKNSGRWHVYGQNVESEPVIQYDFAGIQQCLFELHSHDMLWADFHRLAGTDCKHVVYEDFLENTEPMLRDIIEFLGFSSRLEFEPLVLRQGLRMQRDANSSELKEAFLAELYGDPVAEKPRDVITPAVPGQT